MPLWHQFVLHRSVGAGRLHQRKQFIDGLLSDLPHAIGIVHSRNVDALHDRSDFVAKVGEKSQWIGRIVSDTRDQARDQNLAGNHSSIQFIHHALLIGSPSRVPDSRYFSPLLRQSRESGVSCLYYWLFMHSLEDRDILA